MSRYAGSAKDFVDLIGLEPAGRLFDAYGGTEYRFPKGANNNPDGAARFEALSELVGLSGACELVRMYGGDTVYIPNCRYIRCRARNEQIVREYDKGATVDELARRYKLSGRQVTIILKRTPTPENPEQ